MEITEIRVFLKESPDKKPKAYVTVTFDDVFVVRNIKVIDGNSGLFIAMPSRKAKEPCSKCHFMNEVRSLYCGHCGIKLPVTQRNVQDVESFQDDHKDIAHPITQAFREYLQKKVLIAYEQERSKTTAPANKLF